MNRCGMGIHAYRHVSIKTLPDPLRIAASWRWVRRCKRCGLERGKTVFHYPFIIRTRDWETA